MSQFDELLAQLNAAQEEQSTLAKALPQEDGEDDEAIQAAAEEGAEGDNNPEDEEGGEGDEPLTKSLLIDGEEHEVVDAEALIKSIEGLTGRANNVEDVLAKGMTAMVGMIKGQNELIKSMQGQIAKLSKQGAGRKTVLTVHEKPNADTLAKSQQQDEGMTKEQFMAKSESAWQAGAISGVEFSAVDVALRTGNKLDQGLIHRIVNHK